MSSRRGGSRRGSAAPRAAPVVDSRNPSGRGNARGQSSNSGFQSRFGQPAPIAPPLQHGWRGRSDLIPTFDVGHPEQEDMSGCPPPFNSNDDSGKDNSDLDYCDDDNDDYSSDESQKSHGTRKNCKQFKDFFKLFDSLSLEQLNEPEREWHCAACQGGPGAVGWFRGLQPLINHAKNKKSARARLHRELAELLDEELRRRGTSVISAGQAFGEWKGLAVRDREIVWPPMVIIMNTQLDKDEDGKWRGMGNPELREYFESYDSVKVKHSYGPQGHRGISVLVFETSAVGFLQSEHLSKRFEVQGTGREDWERHPVKFLPGGKRQLYGYMAEKADVEFFNQHNQGKSRLKFEMRSYEEMVMSQIKKMGEDNQQLLWYKYKVVTEKMHSKTLEKSLDKLTEQLRKKSAENCIIKQRSKMHHEQIKEEMEYLEKFNEEQVKFYEAQQEEKENNFEKLQQEEREKVTQYLQSPSEDQQSRLEKVEKFINLQNKDMDEFAEERDKLLKEKEMKKVVLRKKYLQDDVALEEEYDVKLTRLIEKFTPPAQSNEGK